MSDTKSRFLVEIIDRESINLNCVLHILRFDEESVTLMTSEGKVLIEGSKLVIESLNHDNGTVYIKGAIHSLFFSKKEGEKGRFAGTKRA